MLQVAVLQVAVLPAPCRCQWFRGVLPVGARGCGRGSDGGSVRNRKLALAGLLTAKLLIVVVAAGAFASVPDAVAHKETSMPLRLPLDLRQAADALHSPQS